MIARSVHYFAGRSLWLDEAMVALNIGRRSFGELVGRLDFNQAAPLGFLWLEKLAVTVLGLGEGALRLFPFLASLASLLLFSMLARRWLRPWPAALATLLFALSGSLIYYAAEVKQYAFDVALAVLLLWVGMRALERVRAQGGRVGGAGGDSAGGDSAGAGYRNGRPIWLGLGAAGVLGVWFSHPLVFVLPGVLLALWLAEGDRSGRLRPLAAVGLAWAASFAAAFWLTARGASQSPLMARFWLEGFMPIPPTSGADLAWFADALGGWIRNVLDFAETDDPVHAVGIGAGLVLAVAGLARTWRTERAMAVLVAGPIALALLAAALQLYPFKGRLILFLVPSTILLVARGAGVGRNLPRLRIPSAALAGALAASAAWIAASWLRAPYREELRPVLAEVAARAGPDDRIYLHSGAQHAYLFYERACDACALPSDRIQLGAFLPNDAAIPGEIASIPRAGVVWAVFSHDWWGRGDEERDRIVGALEADAERTESVTAPGAEAYRFAFPVDPRLDSLQALGLAGRLREAAELSGDLAAEAWAAGRPGAAYRLGLEPAYLDLYGARDAARAIARADALAARFPLSDRPAADVQTALADFYARAGQPNRASALLSSAVAAAGEPRPAHLAVRGVVDLSNGDPGIAIARLREARDRTPAVDFDLAVALDAVGEADSARAAYDRYLSWSETAGPVSNVAWAVPHALLRAAGLREETDPDGAIARYERFEALRAGADSALLVQVAAVRERLAALRRTP